MTDQPINREALRRSGALTAQSLQYLVDLAEPGMTTAELNTAAEAYIRDHGGIPAFLGHGGFAGSICTSVNSDVVHGLPGKQVLAEGDVLSIDLGVKIGGWYTDSALTIGIGEISEDARRLLATTRHSLTVAFEQATAGRTTGDLGSAVQNYVETAGMGVLRTMTGHGIGKKLHQEPSIPNYGEPGGGTVFERDLVIAIEPMVVLGSPEVVTADDQWTIKTRDGSLAAHFEETVIITDGEPERLTPLPEALSGVQATGRVGKVT